MMCDIAVVVVYFFFNDTATAEIYTLSLHDALPIFLDAGAVGLLRELVADHVQRVVLDDHAGEDHVVGGDRVDAARSEEHTSELQSRQYLVCRLLLEKKKYYIL